MVSWRGRTRWSSSSRRSPPSSTSWFVPFIRSCIHPSMHAGGHCTDRKRAAAACARDSGGGKRSIDRSKASDSITHLPRPPNDDDHDHTGLLLHPLPDLPAALPGHLGLRHRRHRGHHHRREAPRGAQLSPAPGTHALHPATAATTPPTPPTRTHRDWITQHSARPPSHSTQTLELANEHHLTYPPTTKQTTTTNSARPSSATR